MIYEMELLEFDNPLNRTYTHKPCSSPGGECQTGFLFCLVDLPFRNPQSCSLGDHVTPALGGNHIKFLSTPTQNYTYSFKFANIPSVCLSIKPTSTFLKSILNTYSHTNC
jgi:hypothetical protein